MSEDDVADGRHQRDDAGVLALPGKTPAGEMISYVDRVNRGMPFLGEGRGVIELGSGNKE